MSDDHPIARVYERVLGEREPRRMRLPGVTEAAVLIALFEGTDGDERVWLIRRPAGLRKHAGQVALPGGKRDPEDPSPVHTALREAHEEIGLPPAEVRVLGIADEYVTVTRFVVTPIVAWVSRDFVPQPNPAEVSRVFSAPISTFRPQGALRFAPLDTVRRMVRGYDVDGENVWGATAAILASLARLVRIR